MNTFIFKCQKCEEEFVVTLKPSQMRVFKGIKCSCGGSHDIFEVEEESNEESTKAAK